MVRALRHLYAQPYFNVFYDALAIAGVDGTISGRLKGKRVANNVHAKTGSLSHVSSLSGYVKTADGELLAFSMIANNFLMSVRDVEAIQDSALEILADFSRK